MFRLPYDEGITDLEWAGGFLFARTSAGLWVSKAGAENDWKKLDGSYEGGMAVMGAFLIRSVRSNQFMMADPSQSDTLKRSRDGGVTWERMGGFGFRRLAAIGARLYGFSDSTLSESLDSGRTWSRPAPSLAGMGSVEAVLSVDGGLWIGGGDGSGVRALKTGGTAWEPMNAGMYARPVEGLAVQAGFVFADAGGRLMRYGGRAGRGWENSLAGITATFIPQSVLASGGRVYASGGVNGIIVSAAGGGTGTWKTASTMPAGALTADGEWIGHSGDGRDLGLCHAGETLTCSRPAMSGFPPLRRSTYLSLWVYTNQFRSMALSGDEIVIALEDSLYRSTDRGMTWSPFGAPPAPPVFLAYERGKLILGTKRAAGGEALYRWSGSLEGWKGYGDGILGHPAAIAFRGEAETFVATDSGVFRKGAWEERWEDLSGDLKDKEVHTLAVGGDTLAIGLDNGEVRILALDPITGLGHPARHGAARKRIQARAGLIPDGTGRWLRPDGRAAVTRP